MRIVGGKFAGRDLTSPGNSRVRPTSEHVRAALLDYLRGDLAEARVLDLFAGTGALGLEALSRGSKTADFVEMNNSSLHALKANVATFRLKDRTRIFVKDAIHFADALPPDRYDITFADPPYESKQLDWLIRIWQARRFSRILAVEHAQSHKLPRGSATLTFDNSQVTIFRRVPDSASPTGAASGADKGEHPDAGASAEGSTDRAGGLPNAAATTATRGAAPPASPRPVARPRTGRRSS